MLASTPTGTTCRAFIALLGSLILLFASNKRPFSLTNWSDLEINPEKPNREPQPASRRIYSGSMPYTVVPSDAQLNSLHSGTPCCCSVATSPPNHPGLCDLVVRVPSPFR